MLNQTTHEISSVDIRDMNPDGFPNDDIQNDTFSSLFDFVYDSEIIDCVT